jgi:chemotaxis signal transduction protein
LAPEDRIGVEPPDAAAASAEPLCVFERAGRLFAIDVDAVREALNGEEATPIPQAPAHLPGAVNVRGEPLTLLQIDEWIGVRPRPYRPAHQILVLEAMGTRVGLIVDRVYDIRPLGKGLDELPARRGLGPLGLRSWAGGGDEVVVLDAAEIVARAVALAEERFRRPPLAAGAAPAPASRTESPGG